MREIKFRAFVNDKMIYNVPLNKNGKYDHLISTGFAVQYDPEYKEFDVMQFINSNDKNNVEVYENDIMEAPSGEKYIVKWDEMSMQWRMIQDDYWYNMNMWILKKIGNIYENPELLK